MEQIVLDGSSLHIEHVRRVARQGAGVCISSSAMDSVRSARELVDRLVAGEQAVYGVTTGFGKFSEVAISAAESGRLQVNLIRSHACAVGEPLAEDATRAAMALRANALAKGHSGIHPSTLTLLVEMVNRGVHPVIPSQGSLGASGDLAPLAHMALVLIGEGEAFYREERLPGREALARAGLEPVILGPKEGLALINGTQVMTALGALAVSDAVRLVCHADIAAALTLEALRGIPRAFDPRVQAVRPHPGQIRVARHLLNLLEGSSLVTGPGEVRIQDPYTLRCLPQVHGASLDAIEHVWAVLEREVNSATDNPLLFVNEGEVISGGNFHGQPVALALDYLGIAVSELANISERRTERLVNPQLSGLPAFLTELGGLNSGFMLAQYTAASLVSENKILASPASVDSIPSSANQEDHVSMGTTAARKAANINNNCQYVLAIEFLAAAQAVDFREPEGLGAGTAAAYRILRRHVPRLDEDRVLAHDVETVRELIRSGEILQAVEAAAGPLP